MPIDTGIRNITIEGPLSQPHLQMFSQLQNRPTQFGKHMEKAGGTFEQDNQSLSQETTGTANKSINQSINK